LNRQQDTIVYKKIMVRRDAPYSRPKTVESEKAERPTFNSQRSGLNENEDGEDGGQGPPYKSLDRIFEFC
jgi:hypothetical protein